MANIELSNGKIAIVDDEDYPILSRYVWHVFAGYAARMFGSRKKRILVYMHRLILGEMDERKVVDHINRNTLDNRKSNLRKVTREQNRLNHRLARKSKCSSRYVGVTFDKRLKNRNWRAHIQSNGKQYTIGRFDSEELAARAYDKMARKLHGEFAVLNFGDTPNY